jgi:hypothetical protein
MNKIEKLEFLIKNNNIHETKKVLKSLFFIKPLILIKKNDFLIDLINITIKNKSIEIFDILLDYCDEKQKEKVLFDNINIDIKFIDLILNKINKIKNLNIIEQLIYDKKNQLFFNVIYKVNNKNFFPEKFFELAISYNNYEIANFLIENNNIYIDNDLLKTIFLKLNNEINNVNNQENNQKYKLLKLIFKNIGYKNSLGVFLFYIFENNNNFLIGEAINELKENKNSLILKGTDLLNYFVHEKNYKNINLLINIYHDLNENEKISFIKKLNKHTIDFLFKNNLESAKKIISSIELKMI